LVSVATEPVDLLRGGLSRQAGKSITKWTTGACGLFTPQVWSEIFPKISNQTRNEDRCIEYIMYQGNDFPEVFFFYEISKSAAHLKIKRTAIIAEAASAPLRA
jgi:hypothetical protein